MRFLLFMHALNTCFVVRIYTDIQDNYNYSLYQCSHQKLCNDSFPITKLTHVFQRGLSRLCDRCMLWHFGHRMSKRFGSMLLVIFIGNNWYENELRHGEIVSLMIRPNVIWYVITHSKDKFKKYIRIWTLNTHTIRASCGCAIWWLM